MSENEKVKPLDMAEAEACPCMPEILKLRNHVRNLEELLSDTAARENNWSFYDLLQDIMDD